VLKQIKLEIFKLSRRARSYLGFAAMLGLAGLVVLGLAQGPPQIGGASSQGFVTAGSFLNGGFAAWFMLRVTLLFFLPLFACVVTGDMISSESADGTLRTLLSKPVSRESVYCAKYIAAVIYTVALTIFMGIAAYIIGAVFLGRGSLTTFQTGTIIGAQGIYIFPETEGIVRLAAAYIFAAFAILSVASIAFFISSFVSNSLGAIGSAMLTLIAFQIMGMFDFFKPISEYLFTAHMESWSGLFITNVPWEQIFKSACVLCAYSAGFFTLGLIVFARRDILS
jgi:ABC-2 type transport system permease protein